MYNLLVSGVPDAWDGNAFDFEISRCLREYTDKNLTARYENLSPADVTELRRLPSIFACETGCQVSPRFGVIRDVTSRQGLARIEYELIEVSPFLTCDDLAHNLSFELDISKWEMNRTHWALKDVNLAKELGARGIRLPDWARTSSKAVDITKHVFDVALSFPGEVRAYVEEVAGNLEHEIGPNSYFYDNNFVSQLARPSLDVLLQEIYGARSRLVVVFLCEKYQEKEWCGVEFRAIRDLIKKRESSKVMFVRTDQGRVDGVFDLDGYIDATRYGPADIARFIRERVELLG